MSIFVPDFIRSVLTKPLLPEGELETLPACTQRCSFSTYSPPGSCYKVEIKILLLRDLFNHRQQTTVNPFPQWLVSLQLVYVMVKMLFHSYLTNNVYHSIARFLVIK